MSIKFSKLKTELGYSDTLGFGKYHGKTVGWVIEFDPLYLDWCTKKDNLIFLDEHSLERLYSSVLIAIAAKDRPPKKITKNIMYAHADQDDHWDDIPF